MNVYTTITHKPKRAMGQPVIILDSSVKPTPRSRLEYDAAFETAWSPDCISLFTDESDKPIRRVNTGVNLPPIPSSRINPAFHFGYSDWEAKATVIVMAIIFALLITIAVFSPSQ